MDPLTPVSKAALEYERLFLETRRQRGTIAALQEESVKLKVATTYSEEECQLKIVCMGIETHEICLWQAELEAEQRARQKAESELVPLRDAYEATQAALQVERLTASEAAQKAGILEEECQQLRSRLTHLSTMQELSSVQLGSELEDTRQALLRSQEELAMLQGARHNEQEEERGLAAQTKSALENGLHFKERVEKLEPTLANVTAERDRLAEEAAALGAEVLGLTAELNQREVAEKSSDSLLSHLLRAINASMHAGEKFDHTYMAFRKKSHKLKRQHDRLFRDAVSFQSRGQYDEAVNKYELMLSLGVGNGGLEGEFAAKAICSYLHMLEFCLDNRDASFNVLERIIDSMTYDDPNKASRASHAAGNKDLAHTRIRLLELELARVRHDEHALLRALKSSLAGLSSGGAPSKKHHPHSSAGHMKPSAAPPAHPERGGLGRASVKREAEVNKLLEHASAMFRLHDIKHSASSFIANGGLANRHPHEDHAVRHAPDHVYTPDHVSSQSNAIHAEHWISDSEEAADNSSQAGSQEHCREAYDGTFPEYDHDFDSHMEPYSTVASTDDAHPRASDPSYGLPRLHHTSYRHGEVVGGKALSSVPPQHLASASHVAYPQDPVQPRHAGAKDKQAAAAGLDDALAGIVSELKDLEQTGKCSTSCEKLCAVLSAPYRFQTTQSLLLQKCS